MVCRLLKDGWDQQQHQCALTGSNAHWQLMDKCMTSAIPRIKLMSIVLLLVVRFVAAKHRLVVTRLIRLRGILTNPLLIQQLCQTLSIWSLLMSQNHSNWKCRPCARCMHFLRVWIRSLTVDILWRKGIFQILLIINDLNSIYVIILSIVISYLLSAYLYVFYIFYFRIWILESRVPYVPKTWKGLWNLMTFEWHYWFS